MKIASPPGITITALLLSALVLQTTGSSTLLSLLVTAPQCTSPLLAPRSSTWRHWLAVTFHLSQLAGPCGISSGQVYTPPRLGPPFHTLPSLRDTGGGSLYVLDAYKTSPQTQCLLQYTGRRHSSEKLLPSSILLRYHVAIPVESSLFLYSHFQYFLMNLDGLTYPL